MTGTQVPAEELRRGLRIRIYPHTVHGLPYGYLPDGQHAGSPEADAEIDAVRHVGPHEIAVDCHPCYLGGSREQGWCTVYHCTDPVLVIGGAPECAA